MKLRVVFKSDTCEQNRTVNYVELDIETWSTTTTCLVTSNNEGKTTYLPLINIMSFSEVTETAE